MLLDGCVNIGTFLAEKFAYETTRQLDSFSAFLYFEIIHETEPIHRIVTGMIIKEGFSENLFRKDPELSVDILSSKCTSCGFIKLSDCTVFHMFMNSHVKSSAWGF